MTLDNGAQLRRSTAALAAMVACWRRAAACPSLYLTATSLTWRWLCHPQGFPLFMEEKTNA